MSIREMIVDYSENENDIEKWLRVKGEEKYSQFADMLRDIEVPLNWKNISDLYRYDKRLLFNNFRYLSFFEEFARAIIVDNSDDPSADYFKIQDEGKFGQLTGQLLKLDERILEYYFDYADIVKDIEAIRILRNAVAHNKIIIQIEGYKDILKKFSELLPKEFRNGFIKDINSCTKSLDVPEEYCVKLEEQY